MDWTYLEALAIVLLICSFVLLLIILALIRILRWLLNQPGTIKKIGFSDEISRLVGAAGLNESDFIEAYESNWEERLVFMKKGLISNREGIMYIPYANISSVTKESSARGYFIILDADILWKGCILLESTRKGKQPLVETTYRPLTGAEISNLVKDIEEDGGIILFESFEKSKIGLLEESFKKSGFSVKEVVPKTN